MTASHPLTEKVALVAGATRGAGRGTAVALGEAGATVYCTGRTTRKRRSEYDRPETIEETAELVDAAGGKGIALEVDHLEPAEVEALVQRIDAEQGRLDVLVNDIWGGEKLAEWNTPVWEHDLDGGLRMLRLAIDTHLITSHFALALLDPQAGWPGRGDDRRHAGLQRGELPALGVLRPGQDGGDPARVRAGQGARAARLHRRGADAGLDALGDDARRVWGHRGHLAGRRAREPALRRDLRVPRFVGRAVAALAADPQVHGRNGGSFSSGGLAREYGFTDLDGSQPDCWRYLVEVQDAGLAPDPTGYR